MEQQVGGILRLKASGSAVLGRIDQGEISASQSRQSDVVVGEDGLVRPRWAMRTEAMTRYYDDEWGVPKWEDAQVFRILSLLSFRLGYSGDPRWDVLMHWLTLCAALIR